MKGCTCLEVFGEDPDCPLHGVAAVVKRLRNLAAGKHGDLSVVYDAADLIEELVERPIVPDGAPVQWRTIESAPHGVRVLLGWPDWRDGAWCMEVGCASHGRRTEAGSSVSYHGSATHWMPLPEAPEVKA